MDEARLKTALDGLRRFGDDVALRAADLLEGAVGHSETRGSRWTDQLCYCLRECLVTVPKLFGAEPPDAGPLGDTVRRLAAEIAGVIDDPPEVERVLGQLQSELDAAESRRQGRIAQAMAIQAGMGLDSPRLDDFAREWTDTLGRANNVLHGGAHTEGDVFDVLSIAVDLLASIVGTMSNRLEEIDRCLAIELPTDADARLVKRLIADERLARYFFSRAGSGAWLEVLDREGVFKVPMRGDWFQAGLLVRAATQRPELAAAIAQQIARDPHPASAVIVLEVVRELGTSVTALAVQVLSPESFSQPFVVAHVVEGLIEKWADDGQTETLHEFLDVGLQPQERDRAWRVGSKFEDHQFARLADLLVTKVACEHLTELTKKLMLKIRRAARIARSGLGLSFTMDVINGDPARDVATALVVSLRKALQRLRDCGALLSTRKELIEPLDDEILVRVWAEHLAEEEQNAS